MLPQCKHKTGLLALVVQLFSGAVNVWARCTLFVPVDAGRLQHFLYSLKPSKVLPVHSSLEAPNHVINGNRDQFKVLEELGQVLLRQSCTAILSRGVAAA